MISFTSQGNWDKTRSFLRGLYEGKEFRDLDRWGLMGVDALSRSTPRDSGRTAEAWGYKIIHDRNGPRIEWYNNNIHDGALIAVLIQYGHGTGTGGYVAGRDYINPAMMYIFDQIADEMWKQVTSG